MIRDDIRNLPVVDHLAKHLLILIDVGNAVAYAHSRGIVHRDIKPSQVMVGEFGEVLLMDWGLAVSAPMDAKPGKVPEEGYRGPRLKFAPSTMTASNPSGTPAYMAPEQTESTARNIGS